MGIVDDWVTSQMELDRLELALAKWSLERLGPPPASMVEEVDAQRDATTLLFELAAAALFAPDPTEPLAEP